MPNFRVDDHSKEGSVGFIDRRSFLQTGLRAGAAVALTAAAGATALKLHADDTVWQIDPAKCVSCGVCEQECVLNPSAVKCVHSYGICGYCNLCFGFLQPTATEQSTAAENQICPTSAIKRTLVEGPYYEYQIDEHLCIGCSKCVKGCTTFGNGAMHLQIRHDVCVNCNECTIARACPTRAFTRLPAKSPYMLKSGGHSKEA
jgi:electron transport complex protein RnfB